MNPHLNDPLFNRQWYLQNNGQSGGFRGMDLNVLPVWQDYTGAGVRIAVIDDGVDYLHSDLNDNYDPSADFDAYRRVHDGMPVNPTGDEHGTAVAGIIAAEAGNGQGGVGVAFGSTISSIRIDYSTANQANDLAALQRMVQFDVVNNSWVYETPFANNHFDPIFAGYDSVLRNTVANGRSGLGTVVVFSAGNDRLRTGNNSNYSNLLNSRYSISVGALTHTGRYASYSNPGANILVSAFGGDTAADGIFTVDRRGNLGYGPLDYISDFDGTSAAAPMVSGVVALMLEANPYLGYRDVQEILAYSARQTDSSNSSWRINGARTWNGGGLHTSTDYGFGLVDARAAVRLAETWYDESTLANEVTVSGTRSPNATIRDNAATTSQITLRNGVNIEHVEVLVDIDHGWIGDLELVLRSPSGTESVLMNRPGRTVDNPIGLNQQELRFTFSSTQFWGENSAGNWTLMVRDRATGDQGVLENWTLRAFGEASSVNNTYVYTNEFARFGTQAGRAILRDGTGYDTLNAAAVTGNQILNLVPGGRSVIAGRNLTIAANTVIEYAYTGDGHDRIWGNNAANYFRGMRGHDLMVGGFGNDTLLGNQGNDTLRGDAGNDLLFGSIGNDTLSGGAGSDRFFFGRERSRDTLGVDRITDFVRNVDDIVLSKSTFTALTSAIGNGFRRPGEFARVANDAAVARSAGLIVYSQATGGLFYNANGQAAGLGGGSRFATLAGAPVLTANDFILQA